MLSFKELREALDGKKVKSYTVNVSGEKIKVDIVKGSNNKFTAIVAGEKLADSHSSEKAAEKDAADFIKLLGG
jgi:hypothetical protein